MKHAFRFGLLFVLTLAIVVALAPASIAGSERENVVKLTPIGQPAWKPVDFHVFSAPIGTADSGYAEFGETMQALLPPPNHQPHPALGIGPGAPHQPPYDTELAQGVAAQGFREAHSFSLPEFTNGQGVWLVWMTVPNPGTTGSSPDFASGPIIPNSLFPIHVHGIDIHNGQETPVVADFDVPALDSSLDPPFDVDGHSHFPVFLADNADFVPMPNLRGSYEYRTTMIDQQGNGWLIVARFAVGPK
jgi:hypothetical protein